MLSTSDNHGIIRSWERGRSFRLDRVEPNPVVARLVERYWLVRWDLDAAHPFRQEILPHPSIDLIVEPDQSWIWGVPTRRRAPVLTGAGWAVGLKFRPGVFTACTGVEAACVTDSRMVVEAAFGRPLGRYDPDEPASIIEAMEALLAPWGQLEDPALDLVQGSIASMYDLPPNARVEGIAQANHLAPRTLQRLFRRYIGVGPKWVLKRLRIHQAVERIANDPTPNWTELALDLGYYDHAHFIRDFRLIVGRSPTEHAREAAMALTANGARKP